MSKRTIDDVDLKHKTVLIRVDFNVPIKDGKVVSDKRITEALPTIRKAMAEQAKVVLFSHLGRVETLADKKTATLLPVVKALGKKLKATVHFVPFTRGYELEKAIKELPFGHVLMLENTRFEDVNASGKLVKRESKNDPELGRYWASLGDIFINDAFGTAHRAHASNVGIANNINVSALGYLMEKELKMLSKGLDHPDHPFVAIIGGAKVSDKIQLIENLLTKADRILIGGGMGYTFLKAQGLEIGKSLVEPDFIQLAKSLLAKANGKILLPVDHAVASTFADEPRTETKTAAVPKTKMGLDIGAKTIALFSEALTAAKTIVWNGPMGVAEFTNFKHGTASIATAITMQKGAFSLIGGGDSAAAAIELGFEKKFTHISTGGGASLEYMEGKPLPGVEAIMQKLPPLEAIVKKPNRAAVRAATSPSTPSAKTKMNPAPAPTPTSGNPTIRKITVAKRSARKSK